MYSHFCPRHCTAHTTGFPTPALLFAMAVGCWALGLISGCVPLPPGDNTNGNDNTGGFYNNTTDPTNKSATHIGGDACRACHPSVNDTHAIHGHAHKLKPIQGAPPEYPIEGDRAGVPDPPPGFEWSAISYVIGGYTKKARFIDQDGFILTTGLEGVPTQWNLDFPANGTTPSFADYEPEAQTPKPYDFSCFKCHTTGALPQDEDFPEFQENRPGFRGTWEEAGVQCEACHGPGSNHIPDPERRDIFVDVSATGCGNCHTRGDDPNIIIARGGFIQHHEQWPELLASGGHASFNCTTCHDPHVSVTYDRDNAIRNECTACHAGHNLALHEGFTFERGDYVEQLSCESCHMPFATKSATSAGADVVGDSGRMGDTRTHIFRINPDATSHDQFFSQDGSAVAKDAEGRAAVSLDFVCLRCHNGVGNAAAFTSTTILSDVARNMHDKSLAGAKRGAAYTAPR